jgi:NifU-like protein involved in Fe-S cluster formation
MASMTVSPFDRRHAHKADSGSVTGTRRARTKAGSRGQRTRIPIEFRSRRDFTAAAQCLYIAAKPHYQSILGRSAVTVLFMLNDVYNSRILELAGNIPRIGRLPAPDASATAHSKLCGSTVTVDLKMDGDTVSDFAHEVKACALGQASSSIMASHVVGAQASELRELRESVRRMLKENGSPPDGKWEDVRVLEPVRAYKARHASTLLTFDAVVSALDEIEARRARGATA